MWDQVYFDLLGRSVLKLMSGIHWKENRKEKIVVLVFCITNVDMLKLSKNGNQPEKIPE